MTSLLVLALLAGCSPKKKAEKEELRRQEADPFSELNLKRYADEIIPVVERVGGRSFEQQPTVQWLDPEEMAGLVADETRKLVDLAFPGVTEEMKETMAQQSGLALGGILGKYTPATHGVHIGHTIKRALADDRVFDADLAAGVVKLVLAHELVHALQEENSGLFEGMEGIRDKDALDAMRATEEGHATWVQEQVAAELGLNEAHRRATLMQGWEPEGEIVDPRSFGIFATYGQGRNFVAHHVDAKGLPYVWDTVLKQPPATTAMVFRPATYSPEPPAGLDLAGALTDQLQTMTRGEWNTINTTLGEQTLREEAIFTDTEELVRILGHLEQAQRLEGWRTDRRSEIRVLIFEDATWPAQYLDLLRRENLTASQQAAAALGVPITLTWVDVDGIEADKAIRRIEQVPIGGGRFMESEQTWIARGDTCVVVTARSFRPGLRTGRTVDAVFSALDALRAPPGEAPQ